MISSIFAVVVLLLGVACSQTAPNSAQLIDPNERFANITLELPPQSFPVLQTSFRYPPDCGEESYRGSGRLQGMKALITGGDSGMGRAIAIAFVREGASVAINYLPAEEEDAQALVDFLAGEGLIVERIPGDLTNETFCTKLVTEAHTRLNGLNILVNHAGFAGNLHGPNWRPVQAFNTTELEQVYRVNVFAPLWLTRAAIPLLPPGSSIIITSSGLAAHAVATSVLYGSSKAAITHTIRSMALQLLPVGIRVNGVAPGLIYTPFLASGGFTEETIAGALQVLPLGRLAQPAEIAPHYIDIADPTKTYMTGEVVAVLGGDNGF